MKLKTLKKGVKTSEFITKKKKGYIEKEFDLEDNIDDEMDDLDFTHPKKEKVKRPDKKMYIDPKTFRNQILQYYKDEIITDVLSQGIYDIASRLAFSPNFINYTYREEMVGDAIIKMFQALKNKKFNKNVVNKNGQKGNPYSYYSKIAFNAFRNRIKKEKKNHETLLKYQESVYETLIDSGTIIDDQHETAEHEEGNQSYDTQQN